MEDENDKFKMTVILKLLWPLPQTRVKLDLICACHAIVKEIGRK